MGLRTLSGLELNGGNVSLRIEDEAEAWFATMAMTTAEEGIEEIIVTLEAEQALPPPVFEVELMTRGRDGQMIWAPIYGQQGNVPEWRPMSVRFVSDFAHQVPVLALVGPDGVNRLTFSCSETMHEVSMLGDQSERKCAVRLSARFFDHGGAPLQRYEVRFRVDARACPFYTAIPEAVAWLSGFGGVAPAMSVPDVGRKPFYSTWYGYHREMTAEAIEQEAALAARLGMEGMLTDDGWQVMRPATAASNEPFYSYVGDWVPDRRKFPKFADHVARVRAMGFSYLLWFAVPFAGLHSQAYAAFRDKLLYVSDRLGVGVLDPRFPEVREHLISKLEKALRSWKLDGLKLDFIDWFRIDGEDPMDPENPGGRDMRSVPEAVCRLMTELMTRLRALKPDLLIEFRQAYIGPRIRSFANLLRAGDCPFSCLVNRLRTANLRLTSGTTAVHSDMLQWDVEGSAEAAALQLLNVFFSVPQISMRLAELPPRHVRMLAFWLRFWRKHRVTLLDGAFQPHNPDAMMNLIEARGATESVLVVYTAGQVVEADVRAKRSVFIVNATGAATLPVRVRGAVRTARACDCTGKAQPCPVPRTGLRELAVPPSGLLELRG